MSDPEETKDESKSQETASRTSTPESLVESVNLTAESLVANVERISSSTESNANPEPNSSTTESNAIPEGNNLTESNAIPEGNNLTESNANPERSRSSTESLKAAQTLAGSADTTIEIQLPLETRDGDGVQVLEMAKSQAEIEPPASPNTDTEPRSLPSSASGSVSRISVELKPSSAVNEEANPIENLGEAYIANLPPIISNSSLSSSSRVLLCESPSRRLMHSWKVAPSPEEVVAIEPVLDGKVIRCQDLVVYTAPFFNLSNNNNANVSLPISSEVCSGSGNEVPEVEIVSAAEPPCPCTYRPTDSDNFEMVCRICHDTPSKMSCITPCLCKGSMGLVHRECLERWLGESLKTSCEICGYQYVTTRRPRYSGCSSVCAWLKSPVNQSDTRNLFFDIACFFILTPLAIISSWLCVIGARHYTSMGQQDIPHPKPYDNPHSHRTKMHRYRGEDASNSTWTSVGLLALTGTLLAAYYVWLFVALRYHYQIWNDWKLRNYVVTVLPIPPEPERSQIHAHPPTANNTLVQSAAPRVSRHRKSSSETINMNYYEPEQGAVDSPFSFSPFSTPRPGSSGTRPNQNLQVIHVGSPSSSSDTSEGSTATTSSTTSTDSGGERTLPNAADVRAHRKMYIVPKK